MARPADTNFQNFLLRTACRKNLTTEGLYALAQTRGLRLTRSRRRDTNRPSQYAWQHQLRRDQNSLAAQGVYQRNADGTWGLA